MQHSQFFIIKGKRKYPIHLFYKIRSVCKQSIQNNFCVICRLKTLPPLFQLSP